jgi:hypothetical protein
MRLKYPDITRNKLILKIIKNIRIKSLSFKNLIRTYSLNITQIRDKILKKEKLDINHWINGLYNENQLKSINDMIEKLI